MLNGFISGFIFLFNIALQTKGKIYRFDLGGVGFICWLNLEGWFRKIYFKGSIVRHTRLIFLKKYLHFANNVHYKIFELCLVFKKISSGGSVWLSSFNSEISF